MYVYRYSKLAGVYTVGSYQNDEWFPDSDWKTREEAEKQVRQLNREMRQESTTAPQPSNEQLTIALIAGMLMASGKEASDFSAVTVAREILDTVYKTESE